MKVLFQVILFSVHASMMSRLHRYLRSGSSNGLPRGRSFAFGLVIPIISVLSAGMSRLCFLDVEFSLDDGVAAFRPIVGFAIPFPFLR